MSLHLHNEIEQLKCNLLALAVAVENQLEKAIIAVKTGNSCLAQDVIDGDTHIDTEEINIEESCLKIMALHQPVAVDLRFLVVVLKINSDLERIGDLAVNIAERCVFLSVRDRIDEPFDLDTMSRFARTMVRRSLDALVLRDPNIAAQVCQDDEKLDAMNRDFYYRFFKEVRSNVDIVEQLIQYLSISRHLERVGDYAANIAEDVIYMVEGRIIRHDHKAHLEDFIPRSALKAAGGGTPVEERERLYLASKFDLAHD